MSLLYYKGRLSLLVVLLLLFSGTSLCLASPSSNAKATAPTEEDGETENAAGSTAEKVFKAILGQPADTTLYLGMWSTHLTNRQEDYNTTNNLIGLCYNGYFLGTFINSFDDRGWSGGFQRDVYRTRYRGESSLRAGYRLGLIYGYKELSLYDTELFPMLQLYADLSYRKVGLEIAWAGSVFTAGFFYRF